MKKTSEKILFFGSGPVAAKSLQLLAQDFDIEAVITKPSTVHEMEMAINDTLVFTVADRQELSELIETKQFSSRVGVLIDFGIIVSQDVIDYFPLGVVNSHFSLLPQWRGADPITFAILSGQKQTGISLMLLVEKMDEGPLLAQAEYDIPDNTTTPELTDALIELSYETLKAILPLYLSGELATKPQPDKNISYSRKLTKQDGLIDWHQPAEQIEREIRAFIEWPKSRTTLANKEVILTQAQVELKAESLKLRASASKLQAPSSKLQVGEVFVTEDKRLAVQSGEGILIIEKLKPAGKNEMTAKEFLAGYGHLL